MLIDKISVKYFLSPRKKRPESIKPEWRKTERRKGKNYDKKCLRVTKIASIVSIMFEMESKFNLMKQWIVNFRAIFYFFQLSSPIVQSLISSKVLFW